MNLGSKIKLLITDFDGTLVDTFRANYLAYQKAFQDIGLELTGKVYRGCFGLRFDEFMQTVGVTDADVAQKIRKTKGQCYPDFFHEFQVNKTLLSLIKTFKVAGGKTAIASTARRENLENALRHIGALDSFDLILAGEEVENGKPSPEIYNKVLEHFEVSPKDALVFEDSQVGIEAAQAAGINYIVINQVYYGDKS